MAEPIDFYFEFASPYGYFASLRMSRQEVLDEYRGTQRRRKSAGIPSGRFRPAFTV